MYIRTRPRGCETTTHPVEVTGPTWGLRHWLRTKTLVFSHKTLFLSNVRNNFRQSTSQKFTRMGARVHWLRGCYVELECKAMQQQRFGFPRSPVDTFVFSLCVKSRSSLFSSLKMLVLLVWFCWMLLGHPRTSLNHMQCMQCMQCDDFCFWNEFARPREAWEVAFLVGDIFFTILFTGDVLLRIVMLKLRLLGTWIWRGKKG